MGNQSKEIKELKQALLKANQDIEELSSIRSDFMSLVSHELRTPLASIKESVSLVLDGVAGPINEDQERFLKMTKSNIDRLAGIITDMLDFSRLESGRITMHKRKMNVNEVIKDVAGAVKGGIEQEGLEFNLQLSDEVEPVWFDPDRISQVLRHILSNAVNFNSEKGKIKISSSKECVNDREVIKVSIEDTGIGISKKDIPKLFKHFRPLDTSMTRRHKGIGLGLALTRNILRYHGGDIWVESERDIGSRFIFTLPIYRKDAEFNFLLDEAIERARRNDLKMVLIIFGVKDPNAAKDEALSELEKTIQGIVRSPEDKVIRFKKGDSIAVIAVTDNPEGAMQILDRVRDKAGVPVTFGRAVYPYMADKKDDLVKKAEKDLKRKKE